MIGFGIQDNDVESLELIREISGRRVEKVSMEECNSKQFDAITKLFNGVHFDRLRVRTDRYAARKSGSQQRAINIEMALRSLAMTISCMVTFPFNSIHFVYQKGCWSHADLFWYYYINIPGGGTNNHD